MGVAMAIAAVGAVATVAGTASGMKAQSDAKKASKAQGRENEAYANFNAKNIRDTAKANGDQIIAQGRRIRGTQAVQQAGSGVVIGEGSAGKVMEETTNLAARDALVTMYQGAQGSVVEINSGQLARRTAENNAKALDRAKTATLLSGIANLAGSYASFKQASAKK